MMKALKRFLSLALMAMLCLGLLGVSAFGDEYDGYDEQTMREEYMMEIWSALEYIPQEYQMDQYTAESVQALEDAMAYAQSVYDEALAGGSDNETLSRAFHGLWDAVDALEEASDDETDTTDDTQTDDTYVEDTYVEDTDTANDGSGMDSYSEDDDIAPLPEDDGVAMVSEDDGEDEVEAAAVTDETTTEESDAEEESTEPLTYKEVYQAVIDQYVELVESDFDVAVGTDIDLGYLNELLIRSFTDYGDPGERQVYYALEDIDGNGTPELLIGAGSDGAATYDLFFSDGTKPVRLSTLYLILDGMDEDEANEGGAASTFGYRNNMDVLADGTIRIGGSSGAMSGVTGLYEVCEDGCSIKQVLSANFEYDEDGIIHCYLNGEQVSEEEYNARGEGYGGLYSYIDYNDSSLALWDIQWHELGDWDNDTTDGTTDTTDTTDTTACTEHTWDGGQVTTAATTEAEGVMTYTCTVCGETRTETIARLQAEATPQPTQTAKPSSTAPATGDETSIALYVMLALVSVTGLAVVTVRRRKESK